MNHNEPQSKHNEHNEPSKHNEPPMFTSPSLQRAEAPAGACRRRPSPSGRVPTWAWGPAGILDI